MRPHPDFPGGAHVHSAGTRELEQIPKTKGMAVWIGIHYFTANICGAACAQC